MSATTEKM